MDPVIIGLIVLLALALLIVAALVWRQSKLAGAAVIGGEGAVAIAELESARREAESWRQRAETTAAEFRQARDRVIELETRIEEERKRHEERIRTYAEAEAQMVNTFKALSSDSLKLNAEEFLKRAAEVVKSTQSRAAEEFDQRRKTIDDMVKPIRESLEKYEKTLATIEDERKKAHAQIHEQVKFMLSAGEQLRKETGQLVLALKGSQTRGRWGEFQLRRVVEMAGMTEHVDFVEQASVETTTGRLRPDMIVHLPEGRRIVVDSKAVIDAYMDAVNCDIEEERRACLIRHARHVREQVNQLGAKSYWEQFDNTPEFVVMFLPGESHLCEALRVDPGLFEEAVQKGVILATPMTLIALLKAVAYGWKQEQMAESAKLVFEAARTLHSRLYTMAEHASKIGVNLDRAVQSYNKFVGSYESSVLPQARRIEELNAGSTRELPDAEPIDTQPRTIRSSARGGAVVDADELIMSDGAMLSLDEDQ